MALAATTYAQRARLDRLHTMQLAKGLTGPKKRTTPLPKPRKEAQATPDLPPSRLAKNPRGPTSAYFPRLKKTQSQKKW
jgi:hypothetical protein